MIGWNNTTNKGTNGIFGIPLAYADCCEEQARYTLHSHISIWIDGFNTIRNLLTHDSIPIRNKAKEELRMYFEKIAQASLGDLYDYDTNIGISSKTVSKINDFLIPPRDQDLRHMRHHVHCQNHHGVIGYKHKYTHCCPVGEKNPKDIINTNNIVQKNTTVLFGDECLDTHFSKEQCDVLAYTYPYHMNEYEWMKPIDCQKPCDQTLDMDNIESRLNHFNLRHPLIQLRFNVHDCYHRPSCFKKGPECRTDLPQKHREVATLQFGTDNAIDWYFADGSVKKITPFKYYPKRNIGDQFMNINNDIATTVLACNNNVTSGDKACFFYVTLYQTKHNQKEEAFNYHSVCLALSRRIKKKQALVNEQSETDATTEDISPDFCEGLIRMLTSIYGHTASNVLSSTMAAKLLADESRFQFSHKFQNIPLNHLIEWAEGIENLDFKLRKVKNCDGGYNHVHDTFINNMIYRPSELEHLGLYDLSSQYELRQMSKKRLNSGNVLVESKTTFNLLQEHPSHKYMVMSKRKHIFIPQICSINLLPNIKDIHILEQTSDKSIIDLRERYAMIVLLLFYPYRIMDDLVIDDSYWDKYKSVLSNSEPSGKSLEVIQNIQDVSYNCSYIRKAKDSLEATTIFKPHETDGKTKCEENENMTDVNELAEMFKQLDDTDLEDSNPNMRSLSKIGQRHCIVTQEIPTNNFTLPDITDIPDGITVHITDGSDNTDKKNLHAMEMNQTKFLTIKSVLT